jgi:hypothetical protein
LFSNRKEQTMIAKKRRYEASVTFSAPTQLSEAVERAAQLQYTSTSAYIRQASARSLKSDGVDLSQASEAV